MHSKSGSIYNFFQFLLILFLGYGTIASIYATFFKNKHVDFLTIFSVSSLVLFFAFSIYVINPSLPRIKRLINFFKQHRKLLFISIFSLIVGIFNVSSQYSRGIYIAEVNQLNAVKHSNAIEGAADAQQPPLDYYFTSFSMGIWGERKITLRFHTMLFYLVLCFILPLGIWFLCSSLFATSVGSLLFLINHSITVHSVNGRPLCLALLAGFIFLFFYLSCIQKKDVLNSGVDLGGGGGREVDKSDIFSLIASQYLFTISIGFQPVIFIITLFLSSFWLFSYGKKSLFKKLFLSHCITAILVLPYYIKICFFTQKTQKHFSNLTGNVVPYIEKYDVFRLLEEYIFRPYEQMSMSFILLIAGSAIVLFKKKKIAVKTNLMLSGLVIFPLLFDFVFNIAVATFLEYWHHIVYSFFFILFAVFFLSELVDSLQDKKKLAKCVLIPFLIVFFFNAYSQIMEIKNETRFWRPYEDGSVEKTYNYLKRRGSKKDFCLQFSLVTLPFWRDINFQGQYIFFNDVNRSLPFILQNTLKTTDTLPYIHENDFDRIYNLDIKRIMPRENQKIFFIVRNDLDKKEDPAHWALSSFMDEVKIGRFSVFEWAFKTTTVADREREYLSLLTKLSEKIDPQFRVSLYETLLYHACGKNDKKRYDELLNQYSDLSPFLNTKDKRDITGRFILKRRTRYFKNNDICLDHM